MEIEIASPQDLASGFMFKVQVKGQQHVKTIVSGTWQVSVSLGFAEVIDISEICITEKVGHLNSPKVCFVYGRFPKRRWASVGFRATRKTICFFRPEA